MDKALSKVALEILSLESKVLERGTWGLVIVNASDCFLQAWSGFTVTCIYILNTSKDYLLMQRNSEYKVILMLIFLLSNSAILDVK